MELHPAAASMATSSIDKWFEPSICLEGAWLESLFLSRRFEPCMLTLPSDEHSVQSHSSYASSSASRASTVTKLQKLVLKKRFYERVDDFHNKVILHQEPGLIVYRARCGYSGAVVVLKGYNRDTLTLPVKERVWNEVQMLQNANCPFMLKCFDAFEDQGSWWLVLENSACGDLYNVCQSNGGLIRDEGWVVRALMVPLLQTLAYLHRDGIIHRDIRAENILFNSEKVAKLTGFFWSVDTTRTGYPRDLVGTLEAMAPEVYLINNHNDAAKDPAILQAYPELLSRSRNQYDHKVDVWQLGCLTFEIMSGRTPFSSESSSAEETVRNVLLNTPDFPSWLSDDAVDFISQALHKEADKRPSARELLSHPWIQNQLDSEDNDDYFDPIPPVDYSYYDEAEGIEDRESDEGDEGDEWGAKKVLWYDPRTWGTSQEPSQSSDFKRGAQANQSGGFLGTLSSWIKGTSAKGNDSTDSLVKGLDVELQTIEVKPPLLDSNGNIPSPRKEKNVHKGLSSHLDVSSGESNSADSLGPRDSPRLAEVKTTKKAQIVAEECDVENQVQQRMRVESLTGEERGSTQGYNDLFNLPKDVVPPSVPRPDPQVQYPVVSSLPLPSTLSRQSSGANQQGRKQIDISFSPSPAP